MACDCSNERLAVLETKLELIHEDVKSLNDMHKEALEFKGKVNLIGWLLGAAWAGIIGLIGVIFTK